MKRFGRWCDAGEALRHARRVVCLGYSLPESDLTMKHFLRTTCRAGTRIDVVDPSREAREISGRSCVLRAFASPNPPRQHQHRRFRGENDRQ